MEAIETVTDLHAAAALCLGEADPARKIALTHAAVQRFRAAQLSAAVQAHELELPDIRRRPTCPRLVKPRRLPRRGFGTLQGRAGFIHAIAHIEFNAIDLAWDAVYRFRTLPIEFHADWVTVADDEARHFSMLQQRLAQLGYAYGDFDAHDGLWQMAERTAHSCLQRMALVPRVLEARGLDVTPGMIEKLQAVDDAASVAILELILCEEVAHVAAGSRWFRWCCAREGCDPHATFAALVREHARGVLRRPFNQEARRRAGFIETEMRVLESLTEMVA